MDEKDRAALLGLAVGIALGLWATVGGAGIGLGLISVLVILASVGWLGTGMF